MTASNHEPDALDPRADEYVLERYCSNELSSAETAAVEKVLTESPTLRRVVEELREAGRIGALLRENLAAIPPELRQRLIAETTATLTRQTAPGTDHERRTNT